MHVAKEVPSFIMTLRRRLLPLASLVPLTVSLTACPTNDPDDPTAPDAQAALVVGIQAEDFAGLLDSVHLTATVDGKAFANETVRLTQAPLPKELRLTGAAGARAEVVVEAMSSPSITPIVVRRAAARLVSDATKLLRLQLDARCSTRVAPGSSTPPPPTCSAPQTCLKGVCVSEDVPLEQLETYTEAWPSTPPDICRPASHGPPELYLGTGQTDFLPLTDGQTLSLERGPQGGHHIWIAARMKNLRQSGSITTLTAKVVGEPSIVVPPAAYVFTFDRDEGNYCKLWGLRFQLDSGAADLGSTYKQFLGKTLEVAVDVVDSTKERARSTRTIKLADKLLCPDGTTSTCNP